MYVCHSVVQYLTLVAKSELSLEVLFNFVCLILSLFVYPFSNIFIYAFIIPYVATVNSQYFLFRTRIYLAKTRVTRKGVKP